jgi:hypothetical protein
VPAKLCRVILWEIAGTSARTARNPKLVLISVIVFITRESHLIVALMNTTRLLMIPFLHRKVCDFCEQHDQHNQSKKAKQVQWKTTDERNATQL